MEEETNTLDVVALQDWLHSQGDLLPTQKIQFYHCSNIAGITYLLEGYITDTEQDLTFKIKGGLNTLLNHGTLVLSVPVPYSWHWHYGQVYRVWNLSFMFPLNDAPIPDKKVEK